MGGAKKVSWPIMAVVALVVLFMLFLTVPTHHEERFHSSEAKEEEANDIASKHPLGELHVLKLKTKQLRAYSHDIENHIDSISHITSNAGGNLLSHTESQTRDKDNEAVSVSGGLPKFRSAESRSRIVPLSPTVLIPAPKDKDVAATSKSSSSSSSSSSSLFGIPLISKNQAVVQSASLEYKDSKTKDKSGDSSSPWAQRLKRKLVCMNQGKGGVFLYHVRKAAGTSVRDLLEHYTKAKRVGLLESEGVSLDVRFLSHGGENNAQRTLGDNVDNIGDGALLSVLTLREPVARAMSMYWYEHVGWFDGVQKRTDKCKPLRKWVETWQDKDVAVGSLSTPASSGAGGASASAGDMIARAKDNDWKSNFMKKNPGSVYVEIENYYIKSLTGWQGNGSGSGKKCCGQSDFDHAKRVLEAFDVVLLTEWMADSTQIDAMNAIFPGRATIGM